MEAKKSILMSLLIVMMTSFSASAQMMGPQFPGEPMVGGNGASDSHLPAS